jgi:hypothetical protein
MVERWNPDETATRGLEWAPRAAAPVTLDTPTKAACMTQRCTVAESIGEVQISASSVSAVVPVIVCAEVYPGSSAAIDPQSIATSTYRPTGDKFVGSGVTGTPNAANVWSNINGVVVNPANYGGWHGGTAGYDGYVGSGAATGRVLAITMTAVVGVPVNQTGMWQAQLGLVLSGRYYMAPPIMVTPPSSPGAATPPQTISWTWTYNPDTKAPWTIADLQAFAAGGVNGYSIYMTRYTNIATDLVAVFQAYMQAVTCTENRLAFGAYNVQIAGPGIPGGMQYGDLPTGYGTIMVPLATPAGAAWAKPTSGFVTWLVRRLGSSGRITLPGLDAGAAPPPGDGYLPTLNGLYGYVASMGPKTTRFVSLWPLTSAGPPQESTDGQPYQWSNAMPTPAVFTDPSMFGGVSSGQVLAQTFDGLDATSYGLIRFWCKPGSATQPLVVQVKTAPGRVPVGGTFSLSLAAWNALPADPLGSTFKLVEAYLSAPAVLSLAGYQVEWSTTDTHDGNPPTGWEVLRAALNDNENASFNTTTGEAIYYPALTTLGDVPMWLSSVPAAPASVAAAIQTQTFGWNVCGQPAKVDYAHLTWTATGLGATFARYRIQRSEDGGTTWADIAYLTTEATTSFDDYEGLRQTAATYRMRVERGDGSASPWTTTSPVTPLLNCHEVCCTSNVMPSLNAAFFHTPKVDYTALGAKSVRLIDVYGRDFKVVLTPSEKRGLEFVLPINVNDPGSVPPVPGIPAYNALRALTEATTIPYVCLTTSFGERFFVKMRISKLTHDETNSSMIYSSEVTCTESQGVPYVIGT